MAGKADKKKREREAYDSALESLQVELNQLARWLQSQGQRLLVIFEGRDAAGKGGAIEAISSCLNPRSCKVVALSKPSDRERTQWYFQRYVQHLPAAGEIVLFDRSWYNRAGVEKVFGFCTDAEHAQFLQDAPAFEAMLVNSGMLIRKYYLGCDQEKQEKRFKERIENPLKRWKISPIDLSSREKYDDYTQARDVMFEVTHTRAAPWTMVDMNDQKQGRLSLIQHLLNSIPDHDVAVEPIQFKPLKKAKLSLEIASSDVPHAPKFSDKPAKSSAKKIAKPAEVSAPKPSPAPVKKAAPQLKSKRTTNALAKSAMAKASPAKPVVATKLSRKTITAPVSGSSKRKA
jgi:polyphosphate kinase